MNMSSLTHLQRSYRWQPHLPFMPVHLNANPWAKRYNYKYDTLPIVQVGFNQYTLETTVAKSWAGHVDFFTDILSKWRHHLAMAPMSVDYVPDIRNYDIWKSFVDERKARGYFWYYRTLVFAMYAEFSFVTAGKPNWKEQMEKFCREKSLRVDVQWVEEVDKALCDFRNTKRAGVIIDVATTQLWPYILRYHESGVPTLMDVGSVQFHDKERDPRPPSFTITKVTGVTRYDVYPSQFPNYDDLKSRTQQFLEMYYPERMGTSTQSPVLPPIFHQVREEPCAGWDHRDYQNDDEYFKVPAPPPANTRRSSEKLDWVEFFEERKKVNKRIEERETPMEKIRRESRLKDSLRINQVHSSGPSKKSVVFKWVQEDSPGDRVMRDDWVPVWHRVKVDRKEVEEVWELYHPSQRIYDSFHNQWDLMVLFDVDAEPTNHDYEDDDDDEMQVDQIPAIDPNQPIAYLDQLNVAPPSTAYSSVQKLSSQIAFIAPANLFAWVCLTLGLRCSLRREPPISYPNTDNYMGFYLDTPAKSTGVYRHLEEFVSYICNKDFDNPRMIELSDFHPKHDMRLDVTASGLDRKSVV